MLQILTIAQQSALLGQLHATLNGLQGTPHIEDVSTSATMLRELAASPGLIVAEAAALARPEWDACRKALARRAADLPLIAVLAEDTPDEQQTALDVQANGTVLLTQLGDDLLPTAKRLLGNAPLVNGVANHIVQTASNTSPVGEAIFDSITERVEATTSRAVERLQPTSDEPLATSPAPGSSPDSPQVFLRGMKLLANGSSTGNGRQVHRTVCSLNCGLHFCGMEVATRDGRLEQIGPADFPDERYRRICLKGLSQLQLATHPERLREPLKRMGARGEGRWQPISWEQALDEIVQRMRVLTAQYSLESMMFFTYSGQLSALNGIAGVYLRLASALSASGTSMAQWGTDSAVPSGIEDTFGQGAGYFANHYTDLINSRLVLIWGADPVKSRVNWWPFFADAKKAGTRLITVDPKYSSTASKSDQWVAIHPGTDLYLALGMLHLIIQNDQVDGEYVRAHTVGPLLVREDTGRFLRSNNGDPTEYVWDEAVGRTVPADQAQRPALTGTYRVRGATCRPAFDLLREMVEPYTPAFVSENTGIPAATVEELAELYATTKPARIYSLYGVDRWHHGATFGRLIATLAALTGNVGIPGGGAGVDGTVHPSLFLTDFTYPQGKRYREINPAQLSEHIATGAPYPIKGMWVAFSNWLNQWPDQNVLREKVLPELDLLVTSDMFMTETARWSDYVLPVASFFERPDMVRGPGPYIQYQPQIMAPLAKCRSDFDIARDVAQRLGYDDLFARTPDEYLQEILAGEPDLCDLSFDDLREQGVTRISGPFKTVAHAGSKFNTPTGRAEFYTERLLPLGRALPTYLPPIEADSHNPLAQRYPLICINQRSRYRIHSTFSTARWLRELDGGPIVTMNPEDAMARHIAADDSVRIFNDRGYVVLRAVISKRVPAGSVYVSEGWQSADFVAGHLQTLTHSLGNEANAFGPNCSFSDVLVDAVREEGEA